MRGSYAQQHQQSRCMYSYSFNVERGVFFVALALIVVQISASAGVVAGVALKASSAQAQHRQQGPAEIPMYAVPHDHKVPIRFPNQTLSSISWRFVGTERIRKPFVRAEPVTGTVPLYGGITDVGEYYIQVKVGGQMVRVQIDTGSSSMALPMISCSSCRHGDKRYDPDKSTSESGPRNIGCGSAECDMGSCSTRCGSCDSNNQACCASGDMSSVCGFFLAYGDGSGCAGALVEDEIEWAPGMVARGTFGAMLSASSDFERSKVDGILGLAYPALACNPTCVTPVYDSLREKIGFPDKFSMCTTNSGGRMVLGAMDASMAADGAEMKYVPTLRESPFYAIKMLDESLYVGGDKVPVTGLKAAIVDSGTTLMILSRAAFNKVKTWLRENKCDTFPGLCGEDSWFKPGDCVDISSEELEQLPTIGLYVGDENNRVLLELKPEHWMLKYKASARNNYRCVGFHWMDSVGGIDVILGNTLQMRYAVLYDRENWRVGFVEAAPMCKASLEPNNIPEGSGEETGDVVSTGGDTHGCETHRSSCIDCSAVPDCAYNYLSKECVNKHTHPVDSILGYPWCVHKRCLCEDRKVLRAGVVIGAGVAAIAVVGLVVVSIVMVVRRRRARSEWYTAASGASALISSSPRSAMDNYYASSSEESS
mmetsp:Transcript_948/g.1837  ORF Transcript_948/g.1837 Transcript_948/m.1837 type:complete len:652 (-) Transcript_948:92-2047(-)